MLDLKNITILSINTRDPELSIKAIERSCKYINFGNILLLSDRQFEHEYIKTIKIPTIKSLEEYSLFCIKDLHKYIDTDYCLLVQPDGFVTNPFMWSDEFLKYDYIGAPWDKLLSQRGLWMCGMLNVDLENVPIIVGNGGFSLRSKKFLKESAKLNFDLSLPEDAFLCIKSRKILQDNGIKFAPVNVAKRFSLESPMDLNEKNITLDAHFGFHGTHGYKKSLIDLIDDIENDVECVKLIKKYYET
jgi:Protein of unknown function (DUF5672)